MLSMAARMPPCAGSVIASARFATSPAAESSATDAAVARKILRMLSSSGYSGPPKLHEIEFCRD
jgi:hypothetical protein